MSCVPSFCVSGTTPSEIGYTLADESNTPLARVWRLSRSKHVIDNGSANSK